MISYLISAESSAQHTEKPQQAPPLIMTQGNSSAQFPALSDGFPWPYEPKDFLPHTKSDFFFQSPPLPEELLVK